MRWFRRGRQQPKGKNKAGLESLPTISLDNFEDWVLHAVEGLGVELHDVSLAPMLDGVIACVRGEGIQWLPETYFVSGDVKTRIGAILKKTAPAVIGFAIGSVPGALASLGSASLATSLADYAIVPPPQKPVSYLKSTIMQVELIPAETYTPYLKRFKKSSRKQESGSPDIDSGEEGALRIVTSFDQLQERTKKKKRLTLYRYAHFGHVKPFVEALNLENIPIVLGEAFL